MNPWKIVYEVKFYGQYGQNFGEVQEENPDNIFRSICRSSEKIVNEAQKSVCCPRSSL